MSKRMLINATHPEETRVVVLNGSRLEEFDFESSTKKQIKGNIYLARVTRVEPSLQAAFVEYGGNRHGFLAFSEIHPDYYQIPVSDREAMIAAEERYTPEDDAPEERYAPTEEPDDIVPHAEQAGDHGHAEASVTESQGLESEAIYELAPSEDAPPSEHGEAENSENDGDTGGFIEPTEAETTVETVGGDDIEEATARPRRVSYRQYKIQEVIKRRQILLIQVTKEERGNKGAALTTYLSLAGRYCVLMPNAGRGGGVSRKITSAADRRRLKDLMEDLDVPDGMGVIVRTAGSERSRAEIHRDYEYLLRLWDDIRELTLRSSAPALIYEEGTLIKRAIRDLFSRDIEEVLVEGEEGYRTAKEFMRMLTPSNASRVKSYRDPVIPLFHRFQVDQQIDQIHNPTVQLKSGGYIVINATEALVAIDVNSGRSTRERNIEETATKTNLEAADEVARQLRLRDMAGLIVIDFIDMEEGRNRGAVERRLKEAMKTDRARIQLGRISPFGLLELSRQRLRPSLLEASTQICPHCSGTGTIRSTESTALVVLRALEEEGIRRRTAEIVVWVPTHVALYILNQKRDDLHRIEERYGFRVLLQPDDSLIPPSYRLDRVRPFSAAEIAALPVPNMLPIEEEPEEIEESEEEIVATIEAPASANGEEPGQNGRRRRRRRRRRGGPNGEASGERPEASGEFGEGDEGEEGFSGEESTEEFKTPAIEDGVEETGEEIPGVTAETSVNPEAAGGNGGARRRRRRGRRGGRRPEREAQEGAQDAVSSLEAETDEDEDAFQGFGPPEDFANDGRSFGFGAEVDVDIAVDPAQEHSTEAVSASEAEAEPTRKRRPRRRKSGSDETEAGEIPVVGTVAAAPEELDAAAKPRRPRRRKSEPKDAEIAETEIQATEPMPVALVEEVLAIEALSPITDSDIVVAEAAPEMDTTPELPASATNLDPAAPPRKGWWRRII